MECLCVSKHKSWLLILLVVHSLMVWQTQGVCIEEERNALLEIKASLIDSYNVDPLPAWIDDSSVGECCDWERVKCNTTTGHVTNLSLSNVMGMIVVDFVGLFVKPCERMWPLNVSLFLHFKELTSLNLSFNCLGNNIASTGLGRLSNLKKLEILDVSGNSIGNDIIPSLGSLTSLRVLHLGGNDLEGYFPALALENLEILDITQSGYQDAFKMQGFEKVSLLKKLKHLNLGGNEFNESLITYLSALPLLKSLDLSFNKLHGSLPAAELAHFTYMEELDLSYNQLNDTPSIQDCKKLRRLKMLEGISLRRSYFNKSIISCLSDLPSLKTLDLSVNHLLGSSLPVSELSHLTNLEDLDLSYNKFNETSSILECMGLSRLKKLKIMALEYNNFNKSIISCLSGLPSLKSLYLKFNSLGGSFPIQELSGLKELETLSLRNCDLESLTLNGMSHLPDLKVLLLSGNLFSGTLPALTSFYHLEILDLSDNQFVGSIPLTIPELSSLRFVSFANNSLNGSLLGLCELKNLHELDLSRNMFNGNPPQCFNNLSSLTLLDISSNRFTGTLMPSPIANLTTLEYADFSNNTFEGSFTFSSFSNSIKLEVVKFVSNNNRFQVETEEPSGWIPMFQLKVHVLSSCNMKRYGVPGFLLHQRKLQVIDLSHNSLEGPFPNWLIENNTMLKALNLRNNSFGGTLRMPLHRNANSRWLDMSENRMNGTIPGDIRKFLPYITYLNLSKNSLDGSIPSSISDLSRLDILDLSNNDFSGEVLKGFFTNISSLLDLKLSKNRLHGKLLSGNISLGNILRLHLDSNCFTGKIGNGTSDVLMVLDISDNSFTGTIPDWISNMSTLSELVVSNNSLEGRFPCGKASFSFLDISRNSFSRPIRSCLNFQGMKHLHLGSNKFTGSIPSFFRDLTNVLTLDIGNNFFAGRIPEFLGELSNLRILI